MSLLRVVTVEVGGHSRSACGSPAEAVSPLRRDDVQVITTGSLIDRHTRHNVLHDTAPYATPQVTSIDERNP